MDKVYFPDDSKLFTDREKKIINLFKKDENNIPGNIEDAIPTIHKSIKWPCLANAVPSLQSVIQNVNTLLFSKLYAACQSDKGALSRSRHRPYKRRGRNRSWHPTLGLLVASLQAVFRRENLCLLDLHLVMVSYQPSWVVFVQRLFPEASWQDELYFPCTEWIVFPLYRMNCISLVKNELYFSCTGWIVFHLYRMNCISLVHNELYFPVQDELYFTCTGRIVFPLYRMNCISLVRYIILLRDSGHCRWTLTFSMFQTETSNFNSGTCRLL